MNKKKTREKRERERGEEKDKREEQSTTSLLECLSSFKR